MKLKEILKDIEVLNISSIKNVKVNGVTNNTVDVQQGYIYVCIKGKNFDGHNLKYEAKRCGATVFVVEEYDYDFEGLQILVNNSRQALAMLAKNFYCNKGMPKVIGVTGTNGKTTTTNIIYHVLKQCGKSVALIGTEGVFFNNKKIKLNMTTPDPVDLYKLLGEIKSLNIEYVVMEVSAHAIALNKIDGIEFKVVALTNITQDHLDFFETFSRYSKTKLNFIKSQKCLKIINFDDKLCKKLAKNDYFFNFSTIFNKNCYCENLSKDGTKFDVIIDYERINIKTKLIGLYNVENILCAILILKKLGINTNCIQQYIQTFDAVEGRLNVYKRVDDITAIIDFAHTPDAIKKIITTVKQCYNGKIITVFGCGGNRDNFKRAVMGKVATELSDYVFITNDNPRYEDENKIIKDITGGIKNTNYEIELNREVAITKAVSMAECDDVILVLGKGAEDYMEICGIKKPYSDKRVLTNLNFVKN